MKINFLITLLFLSIYSSIYCQINFSDEEALEAAVEEVPHESYIVRDIEVFFLANESDESTVDIFIPQKNQTLAFKKYPFHLVLDNIEDIYFKDNNQGFTIMLNERQQELMHKMLEHYNSSSVALLFNQELIHFDEFENTVFENNIVIPTSYDPYIQDARENLHSEWASYNSSVIEDQSYTNSADRIKSGLYLISRLNDTKHTIPKYDKANDRELLLHEEFFFDLSTIDSVYFSNLDNYTFSVHIVLSKETLIEIQKIHDNNKNQEIYFFYDDFISHTFLFDEITQQREFVIPNVEFWILEDFYVTIHGWDVSDPNILMLEEIYKELEELNNQNALENHLYDNDDYTVIKNSYLNYGVYKLYAFNHSTAGEKSLMDSVIIQVINDSLVTMRTNRGIELTENAVTCLENKEGEHYFAFFSVGLFKIQESKHNIIAQQFDENNNIVRSLELERLNINKKEPKIQGKWTLEDVIVDGQSNELPDKKLQYTFNGDGSLIVPDKKGKWLIPPSNDLLILYEEIHDQQVFEIDEWSKNRLVLSISQLYSSSIKMIFIK